MTNPWTLFFDAVVSGIRPESEGPASRMLRIEYPQEYRMRKKNGALSETNASEFIKRYHF